MFVKTFKVKKPNAMVLGIILVIVLAIIAVWVIKCSGGGVGNKYKLPTNTERVKFLTDIGWKVSDKENDVKVVKVPKKFNMVYTAYNKMQKQQGFDLTKHKGDSVEIYTYTVYNYPDKPNNVVAHLMICNNVLVGGDISCTELEGFMHGLMPVKQGDNKNDKLQKATEEQTSIDSSTNFSGFSDKAGVIDK